MRINVVRLFDREDLSRFGLCEITLSDKPVSLQHQFCFQELSHVDLFGTHRAIRSGDSAPFIVF